MNTKPKILVVDDQPINVKLLQRKLEREGMEVRSAFNGRDCLKMVAGDVPDIILLDVMMPEMDGLEVCRHLKADEATQAVPIIFITAKSSKEGKLEGLNAGAADYITKPIDLEETLARVRTQLNIQEVHRKNADLQKRLADARHAAAVGAITQGIAHNLNNLLGVVVGYLDLIKTAYDNPDMVKRSAMLMEQAIHRMVNIVRQLSSIAKEEKVKLTQQPLQPLLDGSVERYAADNDITVPVTINNPTPHLVIAANAEMLENVLGKLLMNAWESYEEIKEIKGNPEDREITIETEVIERSGKQTLVIKVLDSGCGLDLEIGDHAFDPFVTTKTAVGVGMGLTIARHSIRGIGGDITLRQRPAGGTCAVLTHPV